MLERIDGRSYPAWRDLSGTWTLGSVKLTVDHVQGDPYAAPSRITTRLDAGLPAPEEGDVDGVRLAREDWLLRRLVATLDDRGRVSRGSGRSGAIDVLRPGPEVVARTAVRLGRSGEATVRMAVGLPARGRRIDAREGRKLLDDVLAALRELPTSPGDPSLEAHVRSVVRQRSLRAQLRDHGLVAFVEDGSVLPRESGVSEAPLSQAVPFVAPSTLQVTLPSSEGPVTGLGVREGVTLVVGGGFHGKSTVLQALARGHLDHVPGDGREGVVADPDTVKIRAEDGRRIANVDVSAFLGELPGGRSTRPLSTEDASGSTSQAAAIVEARESGARVLLIDEDTSATNLLVRDDRMRALIDDRHEPITPLVARARQLAEAGTSIVMVVGGVGDWLAVADTVIGMTAFSAWDATPRARELAGPSPEPPGPWIEPAPRVIDGLSPPPTHPQPRHPGDPVRRRRHRAARDRTRALVASRPDARSRGAVRVGGAGERPANHPAAAGRARCDPRRRGCRGPLPVRRPARRPRDGASARGRSGARPSTRARRRRWSRAVSEPRPTAVWRLHRRGSPRGG